MALAEWIASEVRPFAPWWENRLSDLDIDGLGALRHVPVLTEEEAASAGGSGSPALLLQPTEDAFKRHAPRGELFRVLGELGAGAGGRTAALLRRYRPVHVHEAGVALLLAIAYTRTDLDRLHLAGARLFEVLGLTADDTLVNLVPAGPSVRFWGLYHAALATRMVAVHPRTGGEDPLRAARRGLGLLPPTVLALPAAEVEGVLEALAAEPDAASELRTVLWVGPPPTPAQRERAAERANRLAGGEVRIQAVWAPECVRALWGEPRPASADPTEATYGLHTYPDLEVLEVRDVEGERTAGEGEPGELVYTSLGWRGTVLVRYATGAWTSGLVTSVPCPLTGRTVPRLAPEAVEGAWQPLVTRTDGGQERIDLRGVPAALRQAGLPDAGVRDWSLRPQRGRLVLGLDFTGEPDRAAAERLARAVQEVAGVLPEVRIGPRAAAARPRLGDAGPEGS